MRAEVPSPEEKNEIENDNEYEKTHDVILVLILVLVLRPPSLTLPEKMGRGAAVLPQRGVQHTLCVSQ